MDQEPGQTLAQHAIIKRIKIMTIGDTLAGKSCLIKRFSEGKFVQKYISTIGIDYGVRKMEKSNFDLRLNFFDASGIPRYADVRSEFYKDADVVSSTLQH